MYYVYYRRIINNQIIGSDVLHGSGTYQFVEDVTPTSCTWSVEPAGMFQTSSGTGNTANLSYKTSPTKLALTVELEGNRRNKTIDLSGLPSGLYFITVTDRNGQRLVRKVVKQ